MAAVQSIGALISLLPQAISFAENAIDIINPRTSSSDSAAQDLALQSLKARQQQDLQNAEIKAQSDRTKVELDAKVASDERNSALRRAVARQRVRFGSQGVSASGGSASAVLLGLFDESDTEARRREELDNLRFGAIDQTVAQRKSLNVLQRTQLEQSNRVSNIIDTQPSDVANVIADGADVFGRGSDIFS